MAIYTEDEVNYYPREINNVVNKKPDPQPKELELEAVTEKPYS